MDSRKDCGGEITPEMIEAGIAVYEAWKPDDFAWQYTEEELVRSILAAAAQGRRFSSPPK